MATTPAPSYRAYQAPTTGSRFGYSNESDPRKLAANQRSVVQSTGDNLMSGDEQLANQYADQASGLEGYLDPVESKLAAGNGGYNASEANQIQLSPEQKSQIELSQADKSQIQLSPEDKARIQLSQGDKSQIEYSPQDVQDIVNKAGISAGQQTAASVGGAERAAAASGGSPAALATYRARAAQTGAANAADAETNARVAAKNAQSGAAATAAGLQSQTAASAAGLQSQGAASAAGLQSQGASTAQQLQSAGGQAVGNARLGQQNQGLSYYSGLQGQKNSNALSEQGLQQGAYGTQTSGTGQAAGLGFQASQTPTTSDKIIGAVGSAAGAFLADGEMGYLDPDGQDAVVGENGPEAVINNAPEAVQRGASDPVRSNTTFMDNGFAGDDNHPGEMGDSGDTSGFHIDPIPGDATMGKQRNPNQPNFLQSYLAKARSAQKPQAGAQPDQWNKTTPYQQAGAAIGKVASLLADGETGGGIGNYLADGDAPWSDQGVSMEADGHVPNGVQVGRAQVFNKPTAIRLGKSESVIPLSFRARAKVRPSAAMPALMGAPRAA